MGKSNTDTANHDKSKGKGKKPTINNSRSGTATPATTTTNTNAASLQENAIDAGKNGGEVVDKEDLWAFLFGRVKKREEVMGRLADSQPAGSEMGRLLRAEAAQQRSSGEEVP